MAIAYGTDSNVRVDRLVAWLAHTDPGILLITANGRTHPRRRALNAILGLSGTVTYCTNVHGDVELRVSPGGEVRVTVQKNADLDCVPGSDAET